MRIRLGNVIGLTTIVYMLVFIAIIWHSPSVLNSLNEFSYAYLVLLMSILVISEIVFSSISYELIAESVELVERSREPDVQVRVSRKHDGTYYIIIWNVGGGSAHDIRFGTRRDVRIRGRIHFGNLLFMRKGIKQLSPGEWHYYHLGAIPEVRTLRDPVIDIVVRYRNRYGDKLTSTYSLDLSVFRHMMLWPPPGGPSDDPETSPGTERANVPGLRIEMAKEGHHDEGTPPGTSPGGPERDTPPRMVTFIRKKRI